MRMRTFYVLVLLTAMVVLAALLQKKDQMMVAKKSAKELLLPTLSNVIDDVRDIQVLTHHGQTHLVKSDSVWLLVSKDNYPVAVDRVNRLLTELSRLERVSAKTKNPRYYEKLGLNSVDEENSRSIKVTLKADQGQELAAIVVGDSRPSPKDSTDISRYMKQAGQAQSWLVAGELSLPRNALGWINTRLFAYEVSNLKRVAVNVMGGSMLSISKLAETDEDFILDDLPIDSAVSSQFQLNQIAGHVARLAMIDVNKRDEHETDVTKHPDAVVMVDTFSGQKLRLHFNKSSSGSDYLLRYWLNEQEAGWVYTVQAYQVEGILKDRSLLFSRVEEGSADKEDEVNVLAVESEGVAETITEVLPVTKETIVQEELADRGTDSLEAVVPEDAGIKRADEAVLEQNSDVVDSDSSQKIVVEDVPVAEHKRDKSGLSKVIDVPPLLTPIKVDDAAESSEKQFVNEVTESADTPIEQIKD
jgi:hypothetical protein